MAPRSATAPISRADLSGRELSTLAAAFASLRGDQTVDWVKFTHLAGYGSVNSARVCFRPVQKKLEAFVDGICKDDFDAASNNASTPAKSTAQKASGGKPRGRPKKRKLDVDEDAIQHPQEALCASHDMDEEDDIKAAIEDVRGSEFGLLAANTKLEGPQDDKSGIGSPTAAPHIGKLDIIQASLCDTSTVPSTIKAEYGEAISEYRGYYYSIPNDYGYDYGEV